MPCHMMSTKVSPRPHSAAAPRSRLASGELACVAAAAGTRSASAMPCWPRCRRRSPRRALGNQGSRVSASPLPEAPFRPPGRSTLDRQKSNSICACWRPSARSGGGGRTAGRRAANQVRVQPAISVTSSASTTRELSSRSAATKQAGPISAPSPPSRVALSQSCAAQQAPASIEKSQRGRICEGVREHLGQYVPVRVREQTRRKTASKIALNRIVRRLNKHKEHAVAAPPRADSQLTVPVLEFVRRMVRQPHVRRQRHRDPDWPEPSVDIAPFHRIRRSPGVARELQTAHILGKGAGSKNACCSKRLLAPPQDVYWARKTTRT